MDITLRLEGLIMIQIEILDPLIMLLLSCLQFINEFLHILVEVLELLLALSLNLLGHVFLSDCLFLGRLELHLSTFHLGVVLCLGLLDLLIKLLDCLFFFSLKSL